MMDTRRKQAGSPIIRAAELQDYAQIRELLGETSRLYPGIDLWWHKTVLPDLRTGRRVAVVLETGESVEGLFIGKPGRRAKLCTLRIQKPWRDRGLGTLLMAEGMRNLVQDDTREVYVTVSEAAEPGCTCFFKSMGFSMIDVQRDRYVHGVDELIYSSPARELKANLNRIASERAARTLFGLVPKPPEQDPYSRTLVMSLRPVFAEMMVRGEKTVEFRRRFSRGHAGAKVLFYVSNPVRALMLCARISHVDLIETEELWRTYRDRGGISRETFAEYFAGVDEGYALSLENVQPLKTPVSLQRLRNAWPAFHPPQAFQVLTADSPIGRLLHSEGSEGGAENGHRDSLCSASLGA